MSERGQDGKDGAVILQLEVVLPRWRCHKIVEAVKIAAVNPRHPGPDDDLVNDKELTEWYRLHGGAVLELADTGEPPLHMLVSYAYYVKHKPEAGGYFVRYEDGYESFSPAKAFEDGYTRIGDKQTVTAADVGSLADVLKPEP
jgi:hypothetical protein